MTKLEVLDQPLYCNSNIVYNGKPIFSQNFAKSGIHKVRDIWDCEKNKIQILYLIHWLIKETGFHNGRGWKGQ